MTICAAIRVGSRLTASLPNALADATVKHAEPCNTSMCVRRPAGRPTSCSNPRQPTDCEGQSDAHHELNIVCGGGIVSEESEVYHDAISAK